ncbi:hypothetical protein [Gordonia sp. SID5947]|uniref:hypothetical protein n=1 Tax=Gordonia sp. SID5947 TaxID=2690315 RepID=UPI00192542AA|nr:hypothetical protein [Gordonia sp. SID5947]
MSGWVIVAIVVPVWVMVSVLLALVIGRAVRLRDRHEKPDALTEDDPVRDDPLRPRRDR